MNVNPFKPTDAQLKQFGLIALIGFPLIGVALFYFAWDVPTVMWTLSILGPLTFVLSLVEARLTMVVYVPLMAIALPIGFVLTAVLLTLIFYGLFTPVGILFRLLGKDPLAKRPDPDMKSYWHVRSGPRPAASYLRLY